MKKFISVAIKMLVIGYITLVKNKLNPALILNCVVVYNAEVIVTKIKISRYVLLDLYFIFFEWYVLKIKE